MARYIDAEKIKEIAKESPECEINLIDLEYLIESVPTEDVKPVVHARWVDRKIRAGGNAIPFCSNCNKTGIYRTAYCPNCGALMVGGEK